MADLPHLDDEALAELQDVMEDDFATLIRTYLNDSKERISGLKSAMKHRDADAFAKTAHSFKGSSINIGAPHLGDLCRQIEKVGLEERLSDAPPLLSAIDAELQQVTVALEALMARSAE